MKEPELRFLGCSGEWEKLFLQDVAEYRNGKAHERWIEEKGTFVVVNAKFIASNGKIRKFTNFMQVPLRKGEVVFVLSDIPKGKALARTYLIDEDNTYTLNQSTACVFPLSSTDSNFLYFLMNRHNYFLQFDDGVSQTHILLDHMMGFNTYYPRKQEQTQIGTLFQTLDTLLTNAQQKHEKLLSLKKAMLTKMFPQKGQTVPEVRFQGFEGEWERKELGELANIYDGTHQTPNYTNSGVMFLSVENIKTLSSNKYISEEDFLSEFKVSPQKHDVLITRIGDIGTANVVISDEPCAYYVSLALLKKKEMNPFFLKSSFSTNVVINDLWERTLHIAFPKKINKNEIEKVVIPHPVDSKEQTLIGNFFRELDQQISLQDHEIQSLKNLKQALLSKMFVS